MNKIKNVFFVNKSERERAYERYGSEHSQYLGMVSTRACGSVMSIYGTTAQDYAPTWIVRAICEYLEKCMNNGIYVLKQDYDFFIYIYDRYAFVEVETKPVVRVA